MADNPKAALDEAMLIADQKKMPADLEDRIFPLGTRYMQSRLFLHPQLTVIGSLTGGYVWRMSNLVQGFMGAGHVSVGFVERMMPLVDNAIEMAYQRGFEEAMDRVASLQMEGRLAAMRVRLDDLPKDLRE